MEQLQEQILQKYEELEEEQLKNAPWFKKGFLWVKFKFRQKTKIVWFNAWRHDKAESLWAAFALSFLAQISTNRRNCDFVPNLLGKLRLFWHRFNLKKKPFKPHLL